MKVCSIEKSNVFCLHKDDGAVRLYKNYDGAEQEDAVLVSAWRALKDMEKSSIRQSGLVCEWHQGNGLLFTGGDARIIKVWDAQQEMPVMVCTLFKVCHGNVAIDRNHLFRTLLPSLRVVLQASLVTRLRVTFLSPVLETV